MFYIESGRVEVVTWRQPRRLSATTVLGELGYDATPTKSDSDDDFHFDASDDISSAAMMNQVGKRSACHVTLLTRSRYLSPLYRAGTEVYKGIHKERVLCGAGDDVP